MNSACTVELLDRGRTSQIQATGFWHESCESSARKTFDFSSMAKVTERTISTAFQTVTAMTDPWLQEQRSRDAVVTICTTKNWMLIGELGWSREQALETRMRLRTFAEDWDAPGMSGYNEL